MSASRSLWLVALAALLSCASALAQPTERLPLSGLGEAGEVPVYWDFRLDQGRGSGQWQKILVPSCWEQQGFGAYFYGIQGRGKPDSDPVIPKERGEYRREFTVPEAWRGRQVRIVFDGVMTDATVRVNGRSAGATHQGAFYRFEYDITELVRFDAPNVLEVQVDKESANASVNVAERRGDYWTFGGIYRPVWLEARPQRNIDWVAMDARADGSLYARVHLGGTPVANERIEARVIDAAGREVTKPWTVELRDSRTAILRGQVSQPRAWSAETPHLYRLKLRLLGGESAHEVETRFGFRTFEVRPRDGLYLNGRKIVLKGVNRHSFHPDTGRTTTRAQSLADARAMKDANMNAVRMSHYPPDRHFLEVADEIGLYVLDELAGWQGSYDTPTGARLIGQMIRRDVNHPSILFWDNGNEGGWNREVDGEFDRWDPQRRPVLHPWAIHSGINTDHYEKYESTRRLSAGPDIFMPTEFLHGLYDGGIGAGLYDYWQVMSASPTVGGGFFWAWADEGVRRTDQQGRIDNHGNSAADGIVGPYGEKEGSYYAVKQLWSPVQVDDLQVTPAGLSMQLSNHYSFTDLSEIQFKWQVVRLPAIAAPGAQRTIVQKGETRGPELGAGDKRNWNIPVRLGGRSDFDVVHLSAYDRDNRELWTWFVRPKQTSQKTTLQPVSATALEDGANVVVQSAPFKLVFARDSGRLVEVRKNDRIYPLRDGPRLVAFRREERKFVPIETESRLVALQTTQTADGVIARATYNGILRNVTWSRVGDAIALDYELAYEGTANIFGIGFDVPEFSVSSKRWVGRGPYRVWQNRLEGGRFDVHESAYNNPVPGESYAMPEFPGYFAEWRWFSLQTQAGDIVVENASDIPFFGLYRPNGGVGPVLELPDVGVALLSVIPAMGSKFDLPEQLGPQSQPKVLSGAQRGRVLLSLP